MIELNLQIPKLVSKIKLSIIGNSDSITPFLTENTNPAVPSTSSSNLQCRNGKLMFFKNLIRRHDRAYFADSKTGLKNKIEHHGEQ
jgi:hypothetical protein